MRKQINTDELEDYLKETADSHRMYPSNRIWTNIRENLHENTRWPALTFISLFIITSLIIGTVFIRPDENIMKQMATRSLITMNAPAPKNTYSEVINPEKITGRTIENILKQQSLAVLPVEEDSVTVSYHIPADIQIAGTNTGRISVADVIIPSNIPSSSTLEIKSLIIEEPISSESNIETKEQIDAAKADDLNASLQLTTTIKLPKAKKSKWTVDYYITPTSSFRRISDANPKAPLNAYNIAPVSNSNIVDVNQVVRHKPAMGVEAGFNIGYKITGQLTLKAGLQFNIRQYDIAAYSSSSELVQMTYTNGYRIDTLNTISNFRVGNGSSELTLKNKYHEISMPLGIEWSNNVDSKLSYGFAASLQPTYIFDKKAYLISNDYKHYAAGAPLFRNWNLNTTVEAFVSYKSGKYTWHLGPQIRYQQLSSYSNKYPIRENLYDYGIKFGFSKTIK